MLDFSGKNRRSIVLYLLITVLVIALFLDGNPTFERIELIVQDSMFQFRGARPVSGEVVICALDDVTMDRIGWPMNRDSLVRLLSGLVRAKPAAVVCDFDWRSVTPAKNRDDDSLLVKLITDHDRIVLPMQFTFADLGVSVPAVPAAYRHAAWAERFPPGAAMNAQAMFGPDHYLADSAEALGSITPLLDADRVVRRFPLLIDYGGVPFASSVLWAVSLQSDVTHRQWWLEPGEAVKVGHREIPIDDRGRCLLNYYGPAGTFAYHSGAMFLDTTRAPVNLAGKIVVVGPTGFAGRVSLTTRTANDVPAVEVTATAIENVMRASYVRTPSYSALFDLLILGLIGVFSAVVLPKVSPMFRFIILGISLFVIVNMQYLLFTAFGWVTQTFYPAIEIIFFMAVSPLMNATEESESQMSRPRKRASRPGVVIDHRASEGSGAIVTSESSQTIHTGVPHTGIDDHSRKVHVASQDTTRLGKSDPTEFVDRDAKPTPPTAMLPTGGAADGDLSDDAPSLGMMPAEMREDAGTPAESPPPAPAPHPESTQTVDGAAPPPPVDPAPFRVEGATQTESGQYLGRYRILEEIGRGAMGIVYKGIDPAINRPVAMKTVRLDLAVPPDEREELRNRLLREAQAAGQLSHPNIVTIYDVGSQGDVHYIAMEFLKGYTLERAVLKKMSLNYKIFAKLMIQVCDALEYAHSNELVHRDVKPANIMVMDNFKVKVMDFGIARMAHSNMTQTGVALGTPSYISPEQLSGQGVDRRSDIYSLGIVMYELLTKGKPFTGDNINKLIFNILNERPRRPTESDGSIPEAFDRICEKALAKDPRERYQYASDLSRDLKEFIASLQPQRMVI